MFAAEKGIELTITEIDLRKGEQFSPEYRQLNPCCTVPALQLDDGTVIAENIAIADYLESVQPSPTLIGKTPTERAITLALNTRIETEGLMAVAETLRNSSPGLRGRALTGAIDYCQIPELAKRGRARLRHFFPMLEQQLGEQSFLLGEQLTLADITAFVTIEFAAWIKQEIPEGHNRLQDWYLRVKSRPSAAS